MAAILCDSSPGGRTRCRVVRAVHFLILTHKSLTTWQTLVAVLAINHRWGHVPAISIASIGSYTRAHASPFLVTDRMTIWVLVSTIRWVSDLMGSDMRMIFLSTGDICTWLKLRWVQGGYFFHSWITRWVSDTFLPLWFYVVNKWKCVHFIILTMTCSDCWTLLLGYLKICWILILNMCILCFTH
jgi:hypothetical protein